MGVNGFLGDTIVGKHMNTDTEGEICKRKGKSFVAWEDRAYSKGGMMNKNSWEQVISQKGSR